MVLLHCQYFEEGERNEVNIGDIAATEKAPISICLSFKLDFEHSWHIALIYFYLLTYTDAFPCAENKCIYCWFQFLFEGFKWFPKLPGASATGDLEEQSQGARMRRRRRREPISPWWESLSPWNCRVKVSKHSTHPRQISYFWEVNVWNLSTEGCPSTIRSLYTFSQ